LHGVYSVAARNEFLVTINLVNLKSGLSRSYSAQGTPEEVMVKLANQLFDEVQKTKFPTEINLAGRRLTLLDQNFIYVYTTAPMHHLWLQARAVCEYQGGRLPSSRELTTLAALGVYRGGIDARAMTREFYYWALEDMTVYVAQGARVVSTSNLNPTEFLQYLCVR